jgi:hypothetical protein
MVVSAVRKRTEAEKAERRIVSFQMESRAGLFSCRWVRFRGAVELSWVGKTGRVSSRMREM